MLTFEQIEKLNAMGFSAKEILLLNGGGALPEPEPKPDPQPEPNPKPEPQPEPKLEKDPDVLAALNQANDTNKKLTELLEKMQADNIKKASGGDPPKKMTADDVIRSFFGKPEG